MFSVARGCTVAGVIPIPFQAYYSATKAALLSYSLALANEVRPFGITVVCVQPGDICTGFTAARMKEMEGDDLYHGRISRSISVMEQDEQKGMLPKVVARKIANIAVAQHTRPVITVGAPYRAICMLMKLLPVRLWNRLVGHIYAR